MTEKAGNEFRGIRSLVQCVSHEITADVVWVTFRQMGNGTEPSVFATEIRAAYLVESNWRDLRIGAVVLLTIEDDKPN